MLTDKQRDDEKEMKARVRKLEAENKRLARRAETLQAALERGQSHVALFKETAYILKKSFKLQAFLDRITTRVLEAANCESASLFLHDPSDDALEFAVVKGPNSRRLAGKRISASSGIAGRVFQTGAPYVCDDPAHDDCWDPTISASIRRQVRNIIAAPLKAGGKTIGVIELLNKKGGEFNREDLALLVSMAAEVAVGLENARLWMEARRRADQFITLSKLSNVLNSTLHTKKVRKRAMEAAIELLECETGSLYLIDEERGELYFEVILGQQAEAVKEIRLKLGEGIAGWVAQQGQSDLVPDTAKDPRWASRVDKKSKFQTRNMVTVPVKAKGKIIGVLQAINKLRGKKFDLEDQHILENLADQVAIALENARLYEEQKQMFKETAEALAFAIEKRDPYTGGHTKRVRDYSMATAKWLNLSAEALEWLELAAILHDIGKIGVEDQILRKPGRLSAEEFAAMKLHPVLGHEILGHVKQLAPAIPGMRFHHERYDGKGYPDGLTDGEAPLIARIICVADTWDAMTSDRPYRKGLADQVANQELLDCSGKQFDPLIVKAFIAAYENGEIKSQRDQGPEGGDPAPARNP